VKSGNEETADSKLATRPDEEEISPEILAVIAAAATVFIGKSLRVQSVGLLGSQRAAGSRWTRQGRASVLSSHNLRNKR
jgi:hypothetical protein